MAPRVADLIACTLADKGASTVFIVTGGGAMHLNDAFGRENRLNKIFCHHEQGASIAAEAYARYSGIPAIVNVTSGPGGINAINGVFGAYTDSVPMIIVSGQVKLETLLQRSDLPLRQLGDQEVDIIKLVAGVTKAAMQLDDNKFIRETIGQAWDLATSGRQGPVWIDVPIDIQAMPADNSENAKNFSLPANFLSSNTEMESGTAAGSDLDMAVHKVVSDFMAAERPVIFAGGGVRSAAAFKMYRTLADQLDCPFVTGWNAHDILPNNHKNYTGRPGSVGDRAGNFTVQNADYVLVLGCRLNIRQVTFNYADFASNAKVCMVDVDFAELNKPTLSIDKKIHADLKIFLNKLLLSLEKFGYPSRKKHSKFLYWCQERVKKYPVVLPEYRNIHLDLVNPYNFVDQLFNKLQPDANVVCGDGTACVVTFQAAIIKESTRLFTNSGCASMGYDVPASIGVAAASNRSVICIAGDGSLMMNIQELQTIKTKNYRVLIFILNNDGYHSIRQTQQNYFPDNIIGCGPDSGLGFPNFEFIAKAFGFSYSHIKCNRDIATELDYALGVKEPHICEIFVDKSQQFSPKITSKKNDDGSMTTGKLIDMWPFLDEEELKLNIISENKY